MEKNPDVMQDPEVRAKIAFSVTRPLTQDEGKRLWAKADHLVRRSSGVYEFSTSLDHHYLTGALDDIARWIADQVETPVTVVGVEAVMVEDVAQ